MSRTIWSIFLFILISTTVIACSKKHNEYAKSTTIKQNNLPSYIHIDLTIESDISPNSLNQLNFTIENKDKTISLDGPLDCESQGHTLKCNSKIASNDNISPGFYRLIIKDQADFGVACDIVEYNQLRPIDISLNKDSSGECIYYQLLDETHLSEATLRNRLNYLTNNNYMNTPMNIMLYELYHYYCSNSSNHHEAWNKMVNAIKNNQHLPENTNI